MFLFFKGTDAGASAVSFRVWVQSVITGACLDSNRPQFKTSPSGPVTGVVHLISAPALERVLLEFDIAAWRTECAAIGVYAGSILKVMGSQSQMEVCLQPVGPFRTCKCYKLMGT
jgi:hypothetical protein